MVAHNAFQCLARYQYYNNGDLGVSRNTVSRLRSPIILIFWRGDAVVMVLVQRRERSHIVLVVATIHVSGAACRMSCWIK